MRTVLTLPILLLAAACSDATPASDGGRPEGPALDQVLGEPRLDRPGGLDLRADLRPDGPKVPAYWKTVPGASLPIQGHSVTLLQNGEVLIVGGETQAKNTPTIFHRKTYRYLPASDTLVEAGELAKPRTYHQATLLSDGRVLVTCGARESDSYLEDTEIFDPSKPAASAWSAGPPLPEARRGGSAIRLANGDLMISGGSKDNVEPFVSVIFLKLGASSWMLGVTPVKEPRRDHVSLVLPGEKVLLVGGTRGSLSSPVYLNSLEVHDLKNGTSTLIPNPMSKQRSFPSATLLEDGRVLIAGGYCGANCTGTPLDDLYDPKTDTLTPISHPGDYPSTHIATKLLDGRVLFAGNAMGAKHLVVAFNPGSPPSWDTLPNLPHPRDRAAGCTLPDGSVLVVGGVAVQDPYTYAGELERFFP